jgi:hypothetical protein
MMLFIPGFGQGEDAVVRGKVEYSNANQKSWDGLTLTVPFDQLKATLKEQIEWPLPKFPAKFDEWDMEDKLAWSEKFVASKEGKKYLEQREALLNHAKVFDIKFDSEGRFVVYDVPVGTYALAARLDRQIEKTVYVFELFAKIEILEDVDEVALPPLQVEITPLLNAGDPAPPFEFASIRGSKQINSSGFDGKFVLLNFWTAAKVDVKADQLMVQEVCMALEEKFDLHLLSVNVDKEPKPAIDLIQTSKLAGLHGTTQGLEHPVLFNFGVRSVPSLWLITGDGKIAMTSREIAMRQREGVELKFIISDRISGGDRSLVPRDPAGKGP